MKNKEKLFKEKKQGPPVKGDKLYVYLENILGHEIIEDAEQMSMLDGVDAYLESEAHMLAEQEIFDEYSLGNDGPDGYEAMLEDTLISGMRAGESADIAMYERIMGRIMDAPNQETRNMLYARFAPEIMKGRDRSVRLIARMERKLEKARELDRMRRDAKNRRVSLRPKKERGNNKSKDRGRVLESVSGGYPY